MSAAKSASMPRSLPPVSPGSGPGPATPRPGPRRGPSSRHANRQQRPVHGGASGFIHHSVDGGLKWSAVGAPPVGDVVDMTIRSDGDIVILTRAGDVYAWFAAWNPSRHFISIVPQSF